MELTKNKLWELRNEIILCSLYLSDYANSFDYDENKMFLFFDGYSDFLEDEMKYNLGTENIDFFELLEEYDNKENLYEYYLSQENETLEHLFSK